ncbi:MAG: hypothetical protein HUU46_05665 [Candidatus Hydrogenedentes bacterium]|nr:hypothetical protein [Candidatus Hydrogenedentota bacterium]
MAKRTSKNPVQEMLGMAGDFVVKQKGKWEHKDWEAFVEKVQKAGVDLSDELKKSLGHILEATKRFYGDVSSIPDKKPAKKAKPSAKAKSKSKAKAKSKA